MIPLGIISWHISRYIVLTKFNRYFLHFLIDTHGLEKRLEKTESAFLLLKNFDPTLQSTDIYASTELRRNLRL